MKLHEMAEIRTGLVVARKKAESGAGNQYKALTLKSFEEDGWVNVRELEAFESVEELSSQYLTQKRDVIVRLSYPHTAVCINENLEGVLIPSLFTVIRLHDQSLLPEFLALYLNSDKIKRRVAQAAVGSAISVIKTGFLKDLSINVYPMEIQRRTIQIHQLSLQEKKLITELMIEKKVLYKALIKELLK